MIAAALAPGPTKASHSASRCIASRTTRTRKRLEILLEPWEPFACRVKSSRPGHFPYVVNLIPGHLHGCDCEGYFRWQRCKHYALALEAAGWLPDAELDGDELDDHGLWETAVAASPTSAAPISIMPHLIDAPRLRRIWQRARLRRWRHESA